MRARERAPALSIAIALSMTLLDLCPALAGEQSVTVGVKHNVEATLYTPDGPGPYPGVLVLHPSVGLEQSDREFGAKLSREGYIALVPAILKAHGIRSETRRKAFTADARAIYDDFVYMLDEMNRLPKIKPGVLGAVGFSNGGYFAAWLAATGKVKAGVGYYGAYSGAATDEELKRFSATFKATSAPFLILHGQSDSIVPVGSARRLDAILTSAGTPHQLVLYPDADHRFERNFSAVGNQAAAQDAWQRTAAFFKTYLR
jgi:carboxymethylenebutenolidase